MPRKLRKNTKDKNNLGLALLFSTFVAFLVILAVFLKAAALIARSSFDGEHRFNVVVVSDKPYVVSFAPDDKNISTLNLETSITTDKIGYTLKIPIDGQIFTKEKEEISPEDLTQGVLLKPAIYSTNLTIVDVARLWFFTKSLPKHAFIKKTLTLSKEQDLTNELETDKIVARYLSNSAVNGEKMSIQIINATGISGLANRMARLISNMGGNVVLLSTAESASNTSQILYVGKKTYTTEKLSTVLGIALKESKTAQLSDIIIIIGKDKVSAAAF